MNSQTHLLIATALLAKDGKKHRRRNLAILAGALAPDLVIFIMAAVAASKNVSQRILWREWYYNPPWQTWIDAFNAIPVYVVLLLTGLTLLNRKKRLATILLFFAAAALIHVASDLPLHVDDGHAHFWPFNQWRFVSSVSYWDPAYFGTVASMLEAVIGLGLIVVLWKRFKKTPDRLIVRTILTLFAALYMLVPLFFWATLSSG